LARKDAAIGTTNVTSLAMVSLFRWSAVLRAASVASNLPPHLQ
jgi:hypothetical protein